MLWQGDDELDEFADVDDLDELCRRLLMPYGAGRSRTRHAGAVELLDRVRGSGEFGVGFAALLLCTCPRWDRATGGLIATIEAADLLSAEELDELAEAFLTEEIEVVYPLVWVSPQWLEVDLDDPASNRMVIIDGDTPAHARRRIEPPLRRWAARRALAAAPQRLDELLAATEPLDPQAHGALILGLLDAAAMLDESERRRLMQIGLATGMARVRRAALDVLYELDGPDAALQRARSDGDAKVRAWQPRIPQAALALSLL